MADSGVLRGEAKLSGRAMRERGSGDVRAAGTPIGSRWQAEQSAEVRWRQEHFRFRFPFYSEKEFSLFLSWGISGAPMVPWLWQLLRVGQCLLGDDGPLPGSL